MTYGLHPLVQIVSWFSQDLLLDAYSEGWESGKTIKENVLSSNPSYERILQFMVLHWDRPGIAQFRASLLIFLQYLPLLQNPQFCDYFAAVTSSPPWQPRVLC